MAELPAFKRVQYEFAAHIRNPQAHPRPGDVEDRRMAIYRDLFYNNVESFLANGFPVLRQLYSDEAWHRLARDFFASHRSHTPYFLEISQEFLDYLQNERETRPDDPPYLLELAHYEWVELALSVADEEAEMAQVDPDGDWLTGVPVLSPLVWILTYRYPVHRISPDYRPEAPPEQPTHLLVYRGRDDEVGFMEINAVTTRLLQLMQDNEDATGRELLERIAGEMQHGDAELVIRGGAQILAQLRAEDILLGTRR